MAGQEQWTVLLSSHDLDEVERLVDTVGFLDAGRLVLSEPFANLHARFRRVDATAGEASEIRLKPDTLYDGWIGVQQAGRVTRFVETKYVEGDTERRAATVFNAGRIEAHPMTLREIFVAIVRDRREAQR
jgi:ABC-2 type transport system ATP-binding protein